MKIHQSPSYDRYSLFDTQRTNNSFKKMQDAHSCENERAADVVISDEGMKALREKLREIKPEAEQLGSYDLTIENTNEAEMEHYFAMAEYSSRTLQNGNYSLEDVMGSIMDAYEARYSEIVREHKNGDRQVSYSLTGETALTLEEDLAALDRAFDMRLSNLDGYIMCQQTNDGSKYLKNITVKKDAEDQEYRDTAVSMMERARKRFLELREKPDYKAGIAKGIIWNIMNHDPVFMDRTKKLFAKTLHGQALA